MKKICTFALAVMLMLAMTACGEQAVTTEQAQEPEQKEVVVEASSIEELEAAVEKDVDDTIEELNGEFEKLTKDIDSYDKYVKNVDKVKAFYESVPQISRELRIKLCKYAVNYAGLIADSDKSNDEKYDALDGLYDCIYEDANDAVYDGIYDGMMDDIYDAFYDGILEDGYDVAPYEEWSDVLSDEYDMWSDCASDVYDEWSDGSSDIYDFWSDMSSEFYDGDMEKAKEKMIEFQEDIEELENEK